MADERWYEYRHWRTWAGAPGACLCVRGVPMCGADPGGAELVPSQANPCRACLQQNQSQPVPETPVATIIAQQHTAE